jgi:hypothetical protein
VLEGEFHKPGCDMERCPFCLGQLISCDCCYQQLGVDASPGTWTYEHGLTEEQARQWDKSLREKGLIPFIVAPNLCARCGEPWPTLFMVADWQDVIPLPLHEKILCRTCYETVKAFCLAGKQDREVKGREKPNTN